MIPTKNPATVRHPDMFSNKFNQFISKCLVKNPEARASSSDLLQHDEFIADAKSPDILSEIIDLTIKERNRLQMSDLIVEGEPF